MSAVSEVRVFAALGDPVRAALVQRLADRGPASTTVLAAPLDISRQAVDKHLRILRDVGVVASRRVGRETRHRIEHGALAAAGAWLEAIGRDWDAQLGLIKDAAERM